MALASRPCNNRSNRRALLQQSQAIGARRCNSRSNNGASLQQSWNSVAATISACRSISNHNVLVKVSSVLPSPPLGRTDRSPGTDGLLH